MSLDIQTITDFGELRAVSDEWDALVNASAAGGIFRTPSWLFPWWHAYRRVLDAELFVVTGRDKAGDLVCLAPLCRRVGRVGPGIKVREIRLMGDAGPRPPALDLLARAGDEGAAGESIAEALIACSSEWDLIDLEPLAEPSRTRAFAVNRLSSHGIHVESGETSGARRIALDVAGALATDLPSEPRARVYAEDEARVRKGVAVLRRLSRLEWAAREENSPLADDEAQQLLEDAVVARALSGNARLARLDDARGAAVAAALVVDEADVAVVLALVVDPESRVSDASSKLLAFEAKAAAERGRKALDVVTGALEHEMPPLPAAKRRSLRVSAYGSSGTAAVARTYGAVRRRVEAARMAPGAAAAGARAAWTKIRSAAANVARVDRLHLYRAQIWTRGIEHTDGLSLRVLSLEEFDGFAERDRAVVSEVLELDVDYSRQKWKRGDVVVYAEINGRPAGVAWCARSAVDVPEIDRTLKVGPHEAYIHDVFVAPQARGRAVAPSMLEFAAKELRQLDVYRCWALIGTDNVASIRAFEKASYTSVADIMISRGGKRDRIKVRPPDPEARQLLGL